MSTMPDRAHWALACAVLLCSLAAVHAAVAPPGYEPAPGGKGEIQPCPPGTAKHGAGNFACSVCGDFSDTGGEKYQPRAGQTECLDCGPGGEVVTAFMGGNRVGCIPGPGYQPGGRNKSPVPCPAGYAKAGSGNFACSACVGQFSDGGAKYQPKKGQNKCLDCGPGGITNAQVTKKPSTSCVAGPGYQPGGVGKGPVPCSVGHAKAGTGNFKCGLCSGQRYQPEVGQNKCLNCPTPGTVDAEHTTCKITVG